MHSQNVILVGVGKVGSALLRQMRDARDIVERRTGITLIPQVVSDVSGLLYSPNGLSPETLEAVLKASQDGRLLKTVPDICPASEMVDLLRRGTILVDATPSPLTEPLLQGALVRGCGLVLANKIPLAGYWIDSRTFFEYKRVRYEVTVGAGLPVISTLNYLLDTGDQVTSIEGCLSGTLGYLCTELERGVPFSKAVEQASELGYTEPDPRLDLGGQDVARKALIMARTCGWRLEMKDIDIESLHPEPWNHWLVGEFLAEIPTLNEKYAQRVQAAQAEGKALRYVAHVNPKGGRVSLVTVPRDGPLGALRGPANYIAIHTARYDKSPLIISGPGAGPEVTAAGIMGDLITLAQDAKHGQW